MMNILNNQKFQTIKTDYKNNWLYIWLNRPESKNALSKKMINELIELMELSGLEKNIRGILLTGIDNSFCSGADLKEFKNLLIHGKPQKSKVISSSLEIAKLLKSLSSLPKIVVSCINGPALAGGFGLACCSDFIFSTEISKFGISEVKIGLTPAQIAPYVINRIGIQNAKKLMLTGDKFGPCEGINNGFLDKVFKNEEEMFTYIDQLIKKLNSSSPNATKITKNILLSIHNSLSNDFSEIAAQRFYESMLHGDTLEGLNAFLDKRKPKWNI